jgi:hypothetical protein
MSTDLRSTSVSQGNQMSTDSDSVVRGTDSQDRAKASIFHIQTGIQAGGGLGAWFASLPPELQDKVI